ncbi:MAG TPA: preprotein translocase subunit YajC [Streptosporangiaceae bacterium]|jgi:preprotein translocase subunit YajC|nr:preprotein translocase subunit YajC [Streptosporangiaceae bacterium]
MGNIATAAAATKSSSGSSTFLILIVVVFIGFYFLLIRPQRNRQRKVQEQQNQVGPGQRVRTTAGMYATVVAVDGDDVVLEVAPGVEVRYLKRAIMEVLGEGLGAPVADQTAEDEDVDETAEPEDGTAKPAVNEASPDLDVSSSRNGTADAGEKSTEAARPESTASKE